MAKKKYTKHMELYGCMMCSFTCYDVEKQAQHYVERHSNKKVLEIKVGDPPWPCEYCGEGFRTVEGRNHHYEKAHQGVMQLKT